MTIKKKNKKKIGIIAFLAVSFLSLGVGAGVATETKTASAATYTTPKYLTSGSTNNGSSTSSGCPSNFKVYMYGSSTSGTSTMYNGELTDWSYYFITVETSAVSDHRSFRLTRNGSTYTSSTLSGSSNKTLFSGSLSDGEYQLEYVCRYAKNIFYDYTYYTYTYSFVVDKSAPTYTLKAGGSTISSGSYTNKQVVYTASDANFYRIRYLRPGYSTYSSLYSTSYTVPTTATNGWYYVYAQDELFASNSTVSFYLDTVLPVGKVTNANGSTISNGGYTNSAIKYTATDTGGVSYYQYKKPGATSWATYTSGTAVSGVGWHTWRSVDKAGNISEEYKVYYDGTSPYGTLYAGTTAKGSGSYTSASYIKYVASDANSGVASCYVKMPGSSYFTTYTSGTQLTTEGTYRFYCYDRSGNKSSELQITRDATSPTGTLYGGTSVVSSGTSTNAAYVKFVPYDAIGLSTTQVKKPGSTAWETYVSGTQLTPEGTYQFRCIDLSGNYSKTYEIVLDRQIPSAQLYVDEQPVANNIYTNGAHVKFDCAETCYVKVPGSDTFSPYIAGVEYYKAGKYVFYGVSEAGNSTGYYTIIIDRTSKPLDIGNVTDGTTNGDVTISWLDGDPELYAPVKSVTINGKAYVKGEPIYTIDTGVYQVKCEDEAGNVWETEFRSTKENVLTKTFQKEYFEAPDAEGNTYTFASYDSAFAFAVAREKSFVRTGTWNNESWDTGIAMDAIDASNAVNGTYFIYKKSGSAEEEVAYFTQERLDTVIAEYAAIGIEDYFYWEKEYAPIADGENLFSYSDGKTVLASSILLSENIGCTVDGEEFIGTEYTSEGEHLLTVSDSWGNSCDYNVIVIRRTSDIYYAVGEGNSNLVVFDRTYYIKDTVTVSITDEYDEMAMFSVFDEAGDLIGNFNLEDTVTLSESGSYTVRAVNHFGSSETFSLVISGNAPTISMEANEDAKRLEIEISESVDDESSIQTLEILKSLDGGETWIAVDVDDYGTPVALGTYSYHFRTSAMYKVVITDEFRTGIDAVTMEIDYEQKDPTGTLNGVTNGGYTNGSVSFTWTDEAVVTLTKDGETVEYKSGDVLTEDAKYVLTFENFDGFKSVYEFVIDTVSPEVVIEGAKASGSVNTDVKVDFAAEGLTAVLYKDGVEVGEYLPSTPITDSAAYKIRVTDLAQNWTEVGFTIDKLVDYAIDINNGGVANSVTITAGEDVEIVFTKDGEAISYTLGDAVTTPGYYTAKITDMLGNSIDVSFTIVKPLVSAFTFNFDNTPGFEKAVVNGEEKRLNYGTLELFESGIYEVGVVANGKIYTFSVEVDATAPTLTLNGVDNEGTTKDPVSLTGISENAELKVFRDDVEIEYEVGSELTEAGNYRVQLTDECGNTTEYTFEIEKSISGGIIALIVIGVLAVAGAIVFIILKKRKVI